jgi:hypothetical protein
MPNRSSQVEFSNSLTPRVGVQGRMTRNCYGDGVSKAIENATSLHRSHEQAERRNQVVAIESQMWSKPEVNLLERMKIGLAMRVEDTARAEGIKRGSAWAVAMTFCMAMSRGKSLCAFLISTPMIT